LGNARISVAVVVACLPVRMAALSVQTAAMCKGERWSERSSRCHNWPDCADQHPHAGGRWQWHSPVLWL